MIPEKWGIFLFFVGYFPSFPFIKSEKGVALLPVLWYSPIDKMCKAEEWVADPLLFLTLL